MIMPEILKTLSQGTLLLIFVFGAMRGYAQELGYQTPPQEIAQLIDTPPTPAVSINASASWMLLLQRPSMPSIEELSQPEFRLAGLRINPRTNGQSRGFSYNSLVFRTPDGSREAPVTGLPENPIIQRVSWSPNGEKVAFTLAVDKGIELWATGTDGQAKRLSPAVLNDASPGSPFVWLPDNNTLVYKAVPAKRGPAPDADKAPSGPVIQENTGTQAIVRTYQDLLKNKTDEDLFDHYVTSELFAVDLAGTTRQLAPAAIYQSVAPSPDGKYFMTETIQKPYSYLVPYSRFPSVIAIHNTADGSLVSKVADIPLSESIPKGFDATRTGPRYFTWRNDLPATLCWVEAQDGGDPANDVAVRDQLYMLDAPFNPANARKSIGFALRFAGITWGDGKMAVVNEMWRANRKIITSTFAPDGPVSSKKTLFDRSYEDRYNDPGSFLTTDNSFGERVLLTANKGNTLFLSGAGASPEGNQPFLDEFDLKSLKTKRLWQAKAPYYEYLVRLLDPAKGLIVTSRESVDEPANYFLRDLKKGSVTALTSFPHPHEPLKGVNKEMIKYEREDGVMMTGTLYTPEGYDKADGPLPVLMWAYPREFKSAEAAGQVSGSPYQFTRLSWGSPIPWVTRGYAVFDNASMPIVGEKDEEPNDSFVKQLEMNAKAAVDKLVSLGVGDRHRIAVGGHSYGAFMTANLLAHTKLFAAGLARSGAYNRTLTPFGFQAEERTYWEAPEVYFNMSPFMHADRIKTPILLIHGEADNNSGTFPIQSERFYNALKGHGATARLVMLPHESHGYQARESVLHTLWEMDTWLERYVKNRPAEDGPAPEGEKETGIKR